MTVCSAKTMTFVEKLPAHFLLVCVMSQNPIIRNKFDLRAYPPSSTLDEKATHHQQSQLICVKKATHCIQGINYKTLHKLHISLSENIRQAKLNTNKSKQVLGCSNIDDTLLAKRNFNLFYLFYYQKLLKLNKLLKLAKLLNTNKSTSALDCSDPNIYGGFSSRSAVSNFYPPFLSCI